MAIFAFVQNKEFAVFYLQVLNGERVACGSKGVCTVGSNHLCKVACDVVGIAVVCLCCVKAYGSLQILALREHIFNIVCTFVCGEAVANIYGLKGVAAVEHHVHLLNICRRKVAEV